MPPRFIILIFIIFRFVALWLLSATPSVYHLSARNTCCCFPLSANSPSLVTESCACLFTIAFSTCYLVTPGAELKRSAVGTVRKLELNHNATCADQTRFGTTQAIKMKRCFCCVLAYSVFFFLRCH